MRKAKRVATTIAAIAKTIENDFAHPMRNLFNLRMKCFESDSGKLNLLDKPE